MDERAQRMALPDAWSRLADARRVVLGTIGPGGLPHLVPCCTALDATTLYFAVDSKPKRSTALQRLANLEADPRAVVLADGWDEDWTKLWWVRASGRARSVDGAERDGAVELLLRRYPQYLTHSLDGRVTAIDLDRWVSWGWH